MVMTWMLIAAFCLAVGTAASDENTGMTLVPAGPFIMGSASGGPEEAPPHRRDLPAFYIDRTEVTNAQYARFVAATGADPPVHWQGPMPPAGMEDLPVTNVSWFDALRYALWAGKRLPTEAEWEKAARGTGGRVFPWGDADDDGRRNLDSEELQPVGRHPEGASPYGCLDMAGNAWEWTADWLEAYPGSPYLSIHYGRRYKVIRGGGAIYYYGAPNTGRCAQRNRALPYGCYDSLGFRCVKDVDPGRAPYDPRQLLRQAEEQMRHSWSELAELAYEADFRDSLESGGLLLEITGAPGQRGCVRTGVPFPRGLLQGVEELRLESPTGMPRRLQATPLDRWPDGSVRWVLVDFIGEGGEQIRLRFGGTRGRLSGHDTSDPPLLHVDQREDEITLETNRLRLHLTRADLIAEVSPVLGRLHLVMRSAEDEIEAHPLPARKMEIEEGGPLHVVARLQGGFAGVDGQALPLEYDLRVHGFAGLEQTRLTLTVIHQAPREGDPLRVKDAVLSFGLTALPAESRWGTDRGALRLPAGEPIELRQTDDLRFTLTRDGTPSAAGTRAPGWMTVVCQDSSSAHQPANRVGCTLRVRHFWQNHPQALFLTPVSVGVRLWVGEEPFEWEGGLAKTWEMVLDLGEGDMSAADGGADPLRAVLPPAWVAGTQALGPLLPRGPEALELLPYWEAMREQSMRHWVRGMPTGLRDFGDAYFGGPYKGKNAYANLEYDVPFNFLLEFLRTGQRWYLDAADAQARHQADIDTDHFTGRQWKHSPGHTTTEAELGHVFVRGLLLHYLLTGERRSLETARTVGDWIAGMLERGEGIGNERQIGWSLNALSGLYEVTGDPHYLQVAHATALRLVEGQAPSGKFAIRWDNRIAFFNGIAMGGLIEVYRHTGDERIATAVERVARRTLGFYPEYACRTLHGLMWMMERTRDPVYANLARRTWEASLEFLRPRDCSTTATYCWRFFPFAARHALFGDQESGMADRRPMEASLNSSTWRALRLNGEEGEFFVRPRGEQPAALLLVLEGPGQGEIELFDAQGQRQQAASLATGNSLFASRLVRLPEGGPFWRLRLTSGPQTAWQIHSDAATAVTVCDPSFRHLPNLYPHAWGFVREGAAQIVLRLEAMGEGFHGATAYDEEGRPLGAVRHFIDLDDPGRYELELRVPLEKKMRRIGLEIHDARVLFAEGLEPYWAAGSEELWHPERLQRSPE